MYFSLGCSGQPKAERNLLLAVSAPSFAADLLLTVAFRADDKDGVITRAMQAELPLAHDAPIWNMQWHPVGHVLATVGGDFNIKFWGR